MLKPFNTKTWNRKSIYEFFRDYEDPFFNITANIDVTHLYRICRNENASFFLHYFYYSLKAAHQVEAFRLRISDNKVVICDGPMKGGITLLHDDNTFSYCYIPFDESLLSFIDTAGEKMEKQKQEKPGLKATSDLELIHYSAIPWLSFTSFKHARKGPGGSVPRIVFGKYFRKNERVLMPISVEVHHALVDGFHVSQYFKTYQDLLEKHYLMKR